MYFNQNFLWCKINITNIVFRFGTIHRYIDLVKYTTEHEVQGRYAISGGLEICGLSLSKAYICIPGNIAFPIIF